MKSYHVRSAVAVVALAFSIACSRHVSDEAIANDVKARFYSDDAVRPAEINVAVNHGDVMLSGEVRNSDIRQKAADLARGVPGVKNVNDQMSVRGEEHARRALPGSRSEEPRAMPPPPAPGRRDTPAAGPPPAEPAARTSSSPDAAAPPPVRRTRVEVPAGTSVSVRMVDAIDSAKSAPGSEFKATLERPIEVNGETLVPRGADATVRLAQSRAAGRIKGRSELELQLAGVTVHGKTYPLTSNSYTARGSSRGTQTATRVGIGAGIGAAIGAIAGGGKGAAIGAAVGGGGATAVQLMTRGEQVKVPSETVVDFDLQAPVSIDQSR